MSKKKMRKEFEEFVNEVNPYRPKEHRQVIVVEGDLFDRYREYLSPRLRYTDIDQGGENLLWHNHVIVKGEYK